MKKKNRYDVSNNLLLRVFFGLFISTMSACTSPRQPLYAWGTYATDTYAIVNKQSDKSKLKHTYDVIIKKSQERKIKQVPPGIYAEYGILLISLGEKDKGFSMLEKEIDVYPEAEVYVRKILNTER